jgi:hypothetical protein
MAKLFVLTNKTLKLTNPLSLPVSMNDLRNMLVVIKRIESTIRNDGGLPLGPIVQYTKAKLSQQSNVDIQVTIIRQSSTFLHHVDPPYSMIPMLRVFNCMYVRFIGKESDMHFAYEKLGVTAYEEGIKLKGDYYTVHVDQQDDILTAALPPDEDEVTY